MLKLFFKDELIKNILSVLSARIILKGINFLSIFILLMYLDPKDMGQYGIFLSTVVLATTFGNIGYRNAIATSIGAGEKYEIVYSIIKKSFPLLLSVSVTIAFLIYYLSDFSITKNIILLTFFAVSFHLIIILRQGQCLGVGNVKLFNFLDVFPKFFVLIGISLSLLLFSFELLHALCSLTLGLFIAALISIFKIERTTNDTSLITIIEFAKGGFPYALGIGLVMLNFNMPIYLTNYLMTADKVGQVFTAIRINDIFLELATAAGLMIFSHSARGMGISDLKKVMRTITFVVLLSFLFVILFLLFYKYIFILIENNTYSMAGNYLKVIVIGLPFVAFNKMAYGFISGLGKPKIGAWIYFLVVLFNIFISFFLTSLGYENGILWGLVASQIFAGIMFFICVINIKNNEIR